MGLFDILADFADIGKDIIMLPVEIGKAAVECATDINETAALTKRYALHSTFATRRTRSLVL